MKRPRQEHPETFRLGCVFLTRDKHDLGARPLQSNHARQSNAVRFAGLERHSGDQHADAGTGFFYCIERRHRILEPNGLNESRPQRHHDKIADVPIVMDHKHGCGHATSPPPRANELCRRSFGARGPAHQFAPDGVGGIPRR
jgi:hypothetical protein